MLDHVWERCVICLIKLFKVFFILAAKGSFKKEGMLG